MALETIIDDAITDETTGIAITSGTDGDAGAAMEVVDTKAANAIVITSVVSVPSCCKQLVQIPLNIAFHFQLNATAAEAAVTKRPAPMNFKPYSCFRFPFCRAAECALCCIVSR